MPRAGAGAPSSTTSRTTTSSAVGDLRRALALEPNHYKALEGLGAHPARERAEEERARGLPAAPAHLPVHARRQGGARRADASRSRARASELGALSAGRGSSAAARVAALALGTSGCAVRSSTKAMRIMLVAPGEPSGTPAVITMPSPGFTKPSSKAMRQALRTMSARFAGSPVSTVSMPQTSDSRRAVRLHRRQADDRQVRPLARDAQRRRARRRVADDRRQLDRVGDGVRRRRDGVGAGRLRRRRRRVHDGVVARVALHLDGDAVHHLDRLERELADRRLPPTA